MQNQIFPTEFLENTTEVYLPKVSVKSQLIYSLILFAIIAILASLPFIFVDVSVQSAGIIRTKAEKTEIKSLVSGKITAVNVAENQAVKANQVLFSVTTAELETQLQLNLYQQKEKENLIYDLNNLTKISQASLFEKQKSSTPLYTNQLNSFRSQMQESLFHQKNIKRELEADEYLFKEKVIARREYDARNYEMTKLKAEFETAFNRQISQWQAENNQLKRELEQLKSSANQIAQQKELYLIKAPTDGNIQQIVGKYVGSYVQTGEVLGIISPDSSLIVECYVPPNNIGLLKKNMPVKFQIDAFNYNEWGLVEGKIIDIANDFTIMQERPVFKIKCELRSLEMHLKNGFMAQLKKGMTTRARFVITKRSLYQLLYDNIDDWVNPKIG
jgi:membrane fusion protein, peptide pheromone/bacteriocin exporter